MRKYIIPGVGVIFCSILIYQTYTLNTIKEELANIKSDNMTLQEEVSSLSDDLSSQIESTLYQELGKSHLTKDVSFKLNKNTHNGYDITVRAELSELKENSKILFMYKDMNSNDWQKLGLKKEGELTYTGKINLLYDKDYQYKIVVKGDKSQSSDIEDLYKYLFMTTSPDVSWNYNDEGIHFSASDNVDYDENQTSHEDKIKSVEVIVNKEKTYKCEYKEESLSNDNDEMVDKLKYYEANIPKKAYGNKLNSLKMKVTYESGIVNIEEVIDKQSE